MGEEVGGHGNPLEGTQLKTIEGQENARDKSRTPQCVKFEIETACNAQVPRLQICSVARNASKLDPFSLPQSKLAALYRAMARPASHVAMNAEFARAQAVTIGGGGGR
jgi:hypothetical protein